MSLANAKLMVSELEAALDKQLSVCVDSLHIYSKSFPSKVRRLFDKQKFADETARIRRLGKITSAWLKRKQKAGLKPSRGHATGSSSKAIGQPSSIKKLEAGFEYDVMVPAKKITADYSSIGGGRPRVSEYLAKYRNAKAPGFPSFSHTQIDEMIDGEAEASMALYNRVMENLAVKTKQEKTRRTTAQTFRLDTEADMLPEFEVRL